MYKPVIFMFSGQGSQYYNMGKELYALEPRFKQWMHRLNDIYYDICGISVINRLYEGDLKKKEAFDSLRFTHPALFMVQYSLAQVLLTRDICPDYVLGSSLGEFVACAVAEVLSVEEILECLAKQVQLVESQCEKGGMLAILSNQSLYAQETLLHENAELAAINHTSHLVVSGSIENLTRIEAYLMKAGIAFLRLPVSYAFHSSWINPIEKLYKDFLRQKSIKKPQTSYISCVTGNNLSTIDSDYFWEIIRKPIRFESAIQNLKSENEYFYLDLGPFGTLAGFVKQQTASELHPSIFPIMTPYGREMKNIDKLNESIFLNNQSTN